MCVKADTPQSSVWHTSIYPNVRQHLTTTLKSMPCSHVWPPEPLKNMQEPCCTFTKFLETAEVMEELFSKAAAARMKRSCDHSNLR